MTVRDATPMELATLIPAVQPRWMGILEGDDGQILGHIALSISEGHLFGHDTKCWAEDARGAAMLWLRARAKARELGFAQVLVHLPPSDHSMEQFWKRRGFKELCLVMIGEI